MRYIVAEAANACPLLLTRRVTPHTFRHTTAMQLLQSNVDLNMIRSWLGHASIETTNGFVEIDLKMMYFVTGFRLRMVPAEVRADGKIP